MVKTKKKFTVYMVDNIVFDNGHTNTNKTRLQDTFAISPAKAVANVMYNQQISKSDLYCGYPNGGYRQSYLVAEETH
jgi:hypothetical protein